MKIVSDKLKKNLLIIKMLILLKMMLLVHMKL